MADQHDPILVYDLGGMDPVKHPYCLGHGLDRKGGYAAFRKTVQAQIDKGWRRLWLLDPYGRLSDRRKRLDMRQVLIETEHKHVVREFRSDFLRPLIADNPKVEVIVYLGTIWGSLHAREHNWSAWVSRLADSVADAVECGASIGLDATATGRYEHDQRYQAWARMLQAYQHDRGREVYAEGLPRSGQWCYYWPALSTWEHWRSAIAHHKKIISWDARPERVCWVIPEGRTEDEWAKSGPAQLAELGAETPAVTPAVDQRLASAGPEGVRKLMAMGEGREATK